VEQQLSSCRHLAACSLLLVAENFSSLWRSSLWRTLEVSSTKPSLFYCNCPNGAKQAKNVRRTSSILHYFQNKYACLPLELDKQNREDSIASEWFDKKVSVWKIHLNHRFQIKM